jgi:hypothetical protein
MTINSTIEALSEAELDLVAGGIWDRPETDKANQNRAAQNGADGTLGGSLGNVIPGLVVEGGGPYSPGHPFDWP